MNDHAVARKARGAFFTPPEIASFITEWALRAPTDTVLEPSCGEAAFLRPAAEGLMRLGCAAANLHEHLHGLDIHGDSIRAANELLRQNGGRATLEEGDFFAWTSDRTFDAVVGNPPYVRYQNFSGDARTRALEAAFRQGVRLSQLASSWAAFTVHAAAFLKPEGRLGLVLPAELLSVKYAAQIRSYLLRRFRSVRLVLFEHLVFPGVLEDVVLLLAEGSGGADNFEVFQVRDAQDLRSIDAANWTGFKPNGEQKWTSALLPSEAAELFDLLRVDGCFEPMRDWGETYLGAVTGNNDYFTVSKSRASELGFTREDLVSISPPGSRHLRGITFSKYAWDQHAQRGDRCYLFSPSMKPSSAALKYIELGEKSNVHHAYKCKVRAPWWQVPLVGVPDLLFTYMNHDRPRLIRNEASSHILNSLYGVNLAIDRKKIGNALLPLATLNSFTLLGAEIVGRAYGGGMLKHEPTEVAQLPMPSFDALSELSGRLELVKNQVAAKLRGSDISPAIDIVDRILLRDHLKLSEEKIQALRSARQLLQQRRMTRGKGQNGKNR